MADKSKVSPDECQMCGSTRMIDASKRILDLKIALRSMIQTAHEPDDVRRAVIDRAQRTMAGRGEPG